MNEKAQKVLKELHSKDVSTLMELGIDHVEIYEALAELEEKENHQMIINGTAVTNMTFEYGKQCPKCFSNLTTGYDANGFTNWLCSSCEFKWEIKANA